jgi:hypothetical protein
MAELSLGFEHMNAVANSDATVRKESGIGLPHSKTWRRYFDPGLRVSVLECGSPMPLFTRLLGTLASSIISFHASRMTFHG